MMNLDLSKAVDAAAAAKWEREMEPAWSSARDGFRDPFRRVAEADIHAALPHILEAVAAKFRDEAMGLYRTWRDDPVENATSWDQYLRATVTADRLRALAEEARA